MCSLEVLWEPQPPQSPDVVIWLPDNLFQCPPTPCPCLQQSAPWFLLLGPLVWWVSSWLGPKRWYKFSSFFCVLCWPQQMASMQTVLWPAPSTLPFLSTTLFPCSEGPGTEQVGHTSKGPQEGDTSLASQQGPSHLHNNV